MISFNYLTDFKLVNESDVSNWVSKAIEAEKFKEGDINYIFCDDEYLHQLNVEFLDHDTLTDIISFDYSIGKILHGDVFISTDRAKENAKKFNEEFEDEIYRLIIHGVLHYCGFKDKSSDEAKIMRLKENSYLMQLSANS